MYGGTFVHMLYQIVSFGLVKCFVFSIGTNTLWHVCWKSEIQRLWITQQWGNWRVLFNTRSVPIATPFNNRRTEMEVFSMGISSEALQCWPALISRVSTVSLATLFLGDINTGNLALQVGGVSVETVKYGLEFYGTSTQEWLLWQGPEAIVP
jgi:hypothetical protein